MSIYPSKLQSIIDLFEALPEEEKRENLIAYAEKAAKCAPQLLEPIMAVEVVSPDEYTGSVTGDLNRRRGVMKGMDSRAGAQVIKADVPLKELFGYITDLRTLTSGRASASLTFSHYSAVPRNLAEKVIEEVKGAAMAK